MKRRFLPLLLAVLVTACGSPDTQVETVVASPVTVEEIVLKPIEEFITTTGTVNATQDALLKAETAGYYRLAENPQTGQPYALGDNVKKDQVIIHIVNPEQENSINIESRQLNLDISQSEYEKQQSLYEKGGVTLREMRNAEVSFIDSRYSYENALIQLAKLKITSPVDGIIVDLPYFTPGIKIDSGAEVGRVMNYEKLNMDVNLPGKLLDRLAEVQPVRVTNYTIPDKVLHGVITQVSPVLDPETRTFKASIDINNDDLLLRPGMFVNVEVIVARNDSTIVIPKDVIMARRNRNIVYVVDSGTAFERLITLGLQNPEEAEVLEGLEVDERLVIEGYETLRNRTKVKITE